MVRVCHKLAWINEFRFEKVNQKPQHRKQFHSTEHRSVKNTNIAHRRAWDHRNTASWDFIHHITALEKHQHRNTASPHVPLYNVYKHNGAETAHCGMEIIFKSRLSRQHDT